VLKMLIAVPGFGGFRLPFPIPAAALVSNEKGESRGVPSRGHGRTGAGALVFEMQP